MFSTPLSKKGCQTLIQSMPSICIYLTMEMVIKSIVGNIVIYKQSLMLRYTVTNQGNQMTMMYTANNLNFCPEFTFPLPTTNFELFHSYFSSIYEQTFIDTTKSTFSQQILCRKSICSLDKFFIREPWSWATYSTWFWWRIHKITTGATTCYKVGWRMWSQE